VESTRNVEEFGVRGVLDQPRHTGPVVGDRPATAAEEGGDPHGRDIERWIPDPDGVQFRHQSRPVGPPFGLGGFGQPVPGTVPDDPSEESLGFGIGIVAEFLPSRRATATCPKR
jgi:hypothetical protein